MEIPSKQVYEILLEKGVEKIHHANSVITSCQFLRNGALISRGTVDRRKMFQTAQKSDKTDRGYGIWFDVFVDSVDIHTRANRANAYGPVLFVLGSEIIKMANAGKVWVTKLNPTKWANKTHEQRWFTSAKDLEDNFVVGRFDQMIVFRHCGGELPICDYLEKIVLDDPNLESARGNIDYFSMAYGALKLAMTEGRIDVRIKRRVCSPGCTCIADYEGDLDRSKAMFIPKI